MKQFVFSMLFSATAVLVVAGCKTDNKVIMGTTKITASEAGDNKSPYQSYDMPKDVNKKDGSGGGSGGGPGGSSKAGYGKKN